MARLGYVWIRFLHRGDRREHGAFPVRLVRARAAARGRLLLLDAFLHRDSFLARESLERLADRGGALGGLPRGLPGGALGASATFSHCSFLFVRGPRKNNLVKFRVTGGTP